MRIKKRAARSQLLSGSVANVARVFPSETHVKRGDRVVGESLLFPSRPPWLVGPARAKNTRPDGEYV
jgi:hypothetical protein